VCSGIWVGVLQKNATVWTVFFFFTTRFRPIAGYKLHHPNKPMRHWNEVHDKKDGTLCHAVRESVFSSPWTTAYVSTYVRSHYVVRLEEVSLQCKLVICYLLKSRYSQFIQTWFSYATGGGVRVAGTAPDTAAQNMEHLPPPSCEKLSRSPPQFVGPLI